MSLIDSAIGALFAISGLAKIVRFAAFKAALDRYQLWTSESVLISAAWIAAEVGAGASAVLGGPLGTLPLLALLGVATGALTRRVNQGARHDCGCSAQAHPVSGRLVAKNTLIIVAIAMLASWERGVTTGSLGLLAAVTGAATGYASVGHGRELAGTTRRGAVEPA